MEQKTIYLYLPHEFECIFTTYTMFFKMQFIIQFNDIRLFILINCILVLSQKQSFINIKVTNIRTDIP